jgi:Ca2+-binding EF-hand superfamily protein
MTTRFGLVCVAAAAAIGLALAPARGGDDGIKESAAAVHDDVQDVVVLGDYRPIFIRLRMDAGGKAFRAAWHDAVEALYKYLDRDGDGSLTKEEVDRGSLPTMVREATGGAAALPHADLDTNPRDGKVSLDELSDVLRPALGPFRVQVGRVAAERNDALFSHLDRDKDGALAKGELSAAVSSLHRFDLDDDELIDRNELEPFSNPIAMANEDQPRRGRFAAVPPVIELSWGDPSFRPVRLMLKKYDSGSGDGSSGGDNRLSPGEFPIDAKEFASADADEDGALDTEELRRLLGRIEPDVELTVKLSGGSAAGTTIAASVPASRPLPPGVRVTTISEGGLELVVGDISLEFHADSGENAAQNAKRFYADQFRAADTDNNKYLEKKEIKDHGPFVGRFEAMDHDADGKLYMSEVDVFVDRQMQAARSQLVLSVSDQGRSIFSIVDQNRDRHLGVREIRGAVARAMSWDHDADGRICSDEIPHHYQLTIGRGRVAGTGMSHGFAVMASPPDKLPTAGPSWFLKMDRNHDGDISEREFLGPTKEFTRLDRDGDGLIDADEAAKAKP